MKWKERKNRPVSPYSLDKLFYHPIPYIVREWGWDEKVGPQHAEQLVRAIIEREGARMVDVMHSLGESGIAYLTRLHTTPNDHLWNGMQNNANLGDTDSVFLKYFIGQSWGAQTGFKPNLIQVSELLDIGFNEQYDYFFEMMTLNPSPFTDDEVLYFQHCAIEAQQRRSLFKLAATKLSR